MTDPTMTTVPMTDADAARLAALYVAVRDFLGAGLAALTFADRVELDAALGGGGRVALYVELDPFRARAAVVNDDPGHPPAVLFTGRLVADAPGEPA
jgi:hypothetical protein